MAISLSIVVPTYREAENLPLLLKRIADALNKTEINWNVIIVDDDSPDETISVCESLSQKFPLELIVRTDERGLASAVVTGMKASDAEIVLCMDADLSHPPEAIPDLCKHLNQADCDFVIGSRYVTGGTTDDQWGLFRWMNSIVATGLARPLTSAKDPMAGFFALRRSDFNAAESDLDPVGYKIGLELIVKCQCRKVQEVPIHFSDRQFGESKLSLKEQLNYIKHLQKLYTYRWPEASRFALFGIVGLSGVVINLAALSLYLSYSLAPTIAFALAIWTAMTWNFFLNRRFTFKNCSSGKLASQYISFCLASLGGAVINWSVASGLVMAVEFFQQNPSLAGLFGIAGGMSLNFMLCKHFVFVKRELEKMQPQILIDQTESEAHSRAA